MNGSIQVSSVIPPSYFQERDALTVARELLGAKLCTFSKGVYSSGIITETEAYCAPEDKASHAFNNKKTKRTGVMYKEGGRSYVYLCYGIHHLFNIVCGPGGLPHAVLIRAVKAEGGIEEMLERRSLSVCSKKISAGPGILSEALGINRESNDLELTVENGIWLEWTDAKPSESQIVSAPRIGIDYAGEWAGKPWRFYIRKSEWVSKKI